MADNLPIPSGSDGQLVVTVDSRQAVRGLNEIESRMLRMTRTVNTGLNRSASAFERFTSFVKSAAAAFAAFVTVRTAIRLMDQFISRIVEVDRAFRGFIASMSIIRGSVAAATEEYQYLYTMSNRLGVSVESSISQYHRLAAALKNVDESGELARHIFSGISQAALVLHSSGRQVTLIFEAIQQMASKGKLSLEELQRQLGNTLPGAVSMAARAMMQSQSYIDAGITSAVEAERKLREQIEKGTINVYEFLGLVAQQLKIEYGQGVEYASKQFTANLNRMRNTVYEFYRQVGDAGATAGLTRIVQEISRLFGESLDGARGLGQSLEVAFGRVADWISNLNPSDVMDFFAAVRGAIEATGLMVHAFFELWRGFDGPETKTPVLNFVEFVGASMAGLMDLISAAVAGIGMLLNSLQRMWIQTKQVFTGGLGIAEPLSNAVDRLGSRMGIELPGKAGRDHTRRTQANLRGELYQNSVNYTNWVEMGEKAFSGENSYHAQTTALFDNLREQVANTAGRTATPGMDVDEFANPLSAENLKELIDRIIANSGAPNPGRDGSGSGTEAAMRRQIRDFDRLENAIGRWRGEAGVTERANVKLERAFNDLNEAVGKLHPVTGELLLTQEDADDIMRMLNIRYEEALDPIGYVIREYDRQATSLRYLGEAADEYTEVLRQQEEWRLNNIKYTEKDIEDLKEKIRLNQDLARSQAAMEGLLRPRNDQRDSIDRIQALGQLSRGYTDPDGNVTQMSEGETAGALVDIFGVDNMRNTQEYYDAQFEIYQNFLERVKEAEKEGLISSQTSEYLKFQAERDLQDVRLQNYSKFFDTLSGLASSSNKHLFAIGKAAALSQATIKGYQAVQEALAAPPGWPHNAANVIAVGVMQASNVAAIASQTPGFKTGGSFTVGGSGGPDSQLVQFWGTPGENVHINTPAQAKALEKMGDGSVAVNVVVNMQGGDPSDKSMGRQIGEAVSVKVREVLIQESRQGGLLWGMRA